VAALVLAKYVLPHSVKGNLAIRQVWATISLSFLAFRMIHVVLDSHAGVIEKIDWLTFLNYIFFAPISVAGPIVRYQEFQQGFASPAVLEPSAFVNSIRRIVIGLVKKVFIATPLTPYVLGNMEPSGPYPFLTLFAACFLYSVYIYADFSGYTDMAIGSASLFGIKIPENFNKPYLATNLQEFWNRWHMTLSNWLRTYLFYPLNKVFVQKFPAQANRLDPMVAVVLTFAIAGIWHGNSWNFLLFGLMHGLGIGFYFLTRKRRSTSIPSLRRTWLARFLTMAYVSIAWIPFVYPIQEIPWLINQALR
jgi:alginate O-acetyltransferase complex protein AlgI